MSLARQMAVVGQTATASFEEDSVQNLQSGKWFKAKVVPVQDIELNESIGRDARESVIFHVMNVADAALIKMGDRVSAIGSTFEILRRTNNPASIHVEFGAMNLASGDE